MTWQDAATIGAILLAAAYLARCIARRIRRVNQGGCQCCANCSPRNADDIVPILTVGQPKNGPAPFVASCELQCPDATLSPPSQKES